MQKNHYTFINETFYHLFYHNTLSDFFPVFLSFFRNSSHNVKRTVKNDCPSSCSFLFTFHDPAFFFVCDLQEDKSEEEKDRLTGNRNIDRSTGKFYSCDYRGSKERGTF